MEKTPPAVSLTIARLTISVLGAALIIFMGGFSLIALVFSSMCTDDGDNSDCAGWIATALFPGATALPCVGIAITVAFRTKETRRAWVIGLAWLALGTLIPLLFFLA